VLTYPAILIDDELDAHTYGPAVTAFKNLSVVRAGELRGVGPAFVPPGESIGGHRRRKPDLHRHAAGAGAAPRAPRWARA
jgi:hypothetical protein